jgi:hypothetical protein
MELRPEAAVEDWGRQRRSYFDFRFLVARWYG